QVGAVDDAGPLVRALLCELTGLADASIDGDAALNTIGIDSISGLDLQARLSQAFGCELPVSELVQGATVDDVIERVRQARSSVATPSVRAITRRAPDAPQAMSFQQERLWFLEQLEPGAAIYNVPGVVRVRGAFDVTQLTRAFEIV